LPNLNRFRWCVLQSLRIGTNRFKKPHMLQALRRDFEEHASRAWRY
jgi:hypothetical protein